MILECRTSRHLEEAVSHYLERGWVTCGGPFIFRNRRFMGLLGYTIWCHGMRFVDKKCQNETRVDGLDCLVSSEENQGVKASAPKSESAPRR